jgi:hypothetical protein
VRAPALVGAAEHPQRDVRARASPGLDDMQTGLAAAEDTLVVPALRRVVAYR